VLRDFIPLLATIQNMNILPPFTKLLATPENMFIGYGTDILNDKVKTGQIAVDDGKANVSDVHFSPPRQMASL